MKILFFLIILPSLLFAAPKKKEKSSSFEQSYDLTLGRYFQKPDDKEPSGESFDLELNSDFLFSDFKFTSYFYYSYNIAKKSDSGFDDPVFTLTTLPKNFVPALKVRYFLVSSIGVSKSAKEVQEQYGALGGGVGIILDTEYLKASSYNLSGSITVSKGFQKTEYNINGISNNNYYVVYNAIGGYEHGNWSAFILGRFYQFFKYISDESSEMFLTVQDVGYMVAKSHQVGFGHANRMPFYDENSGEVSVRVVNPESSYFYVRYTVFF